MNLRIIVTQQCELACRYCSKEGAFSKKENLLDLPDYAFVMNAAKKMNCDTVKFTGGEPTQSDCLHPASTAF